MVESTPTNDSPATGQPDTAASESAPAEYASAQPTAETSPPDAPAPPRRRRATKRAAGTPGSEDVGAAASTDGEGVTERAADAAPPARKRAARKTATKRVAKKTASSAGEAGAVEASAEPSASEVAAELQPETPGSEGGELTPTTLPETATAEGAPTEGEPAEATPARRTRKATTPRRARKAMAPEAPEPDVVAEPAPGTALTSAGDVAPDVVREEAAAPPAVETPAAEATPVETAAPDVPGVAFQAPPAYVVEPGASEPARPRRRRSTRPASAPRAVEQPDTTQPEPAEHEPAGPELAAAETATPEPAAAEPATAEAEAAPLTTPARPRRRRATRAQAGAGQRTEESSLPGDLEPRDLAVDEGSDLDIPTPAAAAEPTEETPAEETPADELAEPAAAEADLIVAAVDEAEAAAEEVADQEQDEEAEQDAEQEAAAEEESPREGRRRRRRGGRGRRSRTRDVRDDESADEEEAEPAEEAEAAADEEGEAEETAEPEAEDEEGTSTSRRRRRRRRRGGDEEAPAVETERPAGRRERTRPRRDEDEVSGLRGSTRLEAKRLRRREGRELGRRRTPLLTESEFLARRESVKRTMVIRQRGKRTQIAVLEDGMLVEHYVDSGETGTLVGSVFLGRVQNVLPSMEAAFIDLGRGRNAVLYAGEVNWDAAGLEGQPKRIELALKSGDPVLVQVTKDPIGHKGARLTSQVSLPGRFLVYVPNGSMTGISRKLPDTERSRLKAILRKVVPEHAGVIVRTAAEGASEEELAADVTRLQEEWERIEQAAKTASAPALLHGEPDLTVRVLRDVFNEDFSSVVVSGDRAWNTVEPYIRGVAPELADRVSKWTGNGDVFAAHRIDEQLAKALDRKVYLPSGGSLVIDRTEAMVVIDVNTGRFTGKGGNLEETVTKNNLEAAEEIVRQLRVRDLGGIIVIDFIDMVLESNRDLVMRRLLECLGRDRTKHQVAEVSSLGLVQMTRKRVGTGLLEAFSHQCEHCKGRGVIVSLDFDTPPAAEPEPAHAAQPARPRAMVPPNAAPSPALLAPGTVRSEPSGSGQSADALVPAEPVPAGAASDNGAGELAYADVAADPVAAEDPVEPPLPLPDGAEGMAEEAPAFVLQGPDPVEDAVDDGRPQRRRRRATRP